LLGCGVVAVGEFLGEVDVGGLGIPVDAVGGLAESRDSGGTRPERVLVRGEFHERLGVDAEVASDLLDPASRTVDSV
jgi:hypothetical protein